MPKKNKGSGGGSGRHVAMFDFDVEQLKAIDSELRAAGSAKHDHKDNCQLFQMVDALNKNDAAGIMLADFCHHIVTVINPIGQIMRAIGAIGRDDDEMDMQGKAVLLTLLFGIKIGRLQAMNDGHIFTE